MLVLVLVIAAALAWAAQQPGVSTVILLEGERVEYRMSLLPATD